MKVPSAHYRQDETGQWWYHEKRGGRTRATIKTCGMCGDEYAVCVYHAKRSRFCSHLCSGRHVGRMRFGGKDHPGWGGGKVMRNGYVTVYSPDHPAVQDKRSKYVFEHRLVMEAKIGRYLARDEQVHHINGVKDDNREENLELWTGSHPNGVRAGLHCPTCTCGAHDAVTLKGTVAA
jgi:hypothetical protein